MRIGPVVPVSLIYSNPSQAVVGAYTEQIAAGGNASQLEIEIVLGGSTVASGSGTPGSPSSRSDIPISVDGDTLLAKASKINELDFSDPTASGWTQETSGEFPTTGSGTINLSGCAPRLIKITNSQNFYYQLDIYSRADKSTRISNTASGTVWILASICNKIDYNHSSSDRSSYVIYKNTGLEIEWAEFVARLKDSNGNLLTTNRTPLPLAVIAPRVSRATEQVVVVFM